ncbi:molybdopterin molybdotransferase MoeA [Paenibacillus thiaminolyticus]|uniref:molybdopterin molybdotransferase MoeA n=1 Tax=Paenibacillus thiaminolyticus TaxID=49283 RepID=UPI002543B568|nr:gephyrin-like molybdotransferase Glp [Paenibacillus thiaminolyticus]WII35362.1 molybdopterin molybdotransferase MoeA [Paenibacillus thiaminolyticus]
MSGRKEQHTFMRQAISVEEATRHVLEAVRLMPTEVVPLAECCGRFLAADLVAPQPVPHFRRSGMDGYALAAADTAKASIQAPVILNVVDNIPAGTVPQRAMRARECARIMTGAAVPDGADAVIPYEKTAEGGTNTEGFITCFVKAPAAPGDNVSPIGMEMEAGETVLRAGTRIGQGEMALLAMFGAAAVQVHRRPRVAIIATGAELLEVHDALQPGRIRNSNGSMIAAAVTEFGGIPYQLEQVADDAERAGQAIMNALAAYDAVVTTGGVSVGDHDIVYDITRSWDGDLKFNKVMMRPGSPTTFGVRQGTPLFALSGNPAACYVGCRLFLRPALRGMMGAERAAEPRMKAVLAADVVKSDRFTRFVRGVLSSREGRLEAAPVGRDMSSITVSLRDANCLICLPGSPHGHKAGTLVDVIVL